MNTGYSKTKSWVLACRPKTLPASLVPVLIGSALASREAEWQGILSWLLLGTTLTAAASIQITTNLVNDLCDFLKGTDRDDRLGPLRVTQAGLISVEQMRLGILASVMFSLALGSIIAWHAGWPLLVVGIISLCFAFLYTTGPYPLAYSPFSEFFVIIFFGPVAVAGSHYVLSQELSLSAIWAGLGCGFISSAILSVNNLRDIKSDSLSGRKTIAVIFGSRVAKLEYFTLIILAALVALSLYPISNAYPLSPVAACYLIAARPVIKSVLHDNQSALNQTLADTGRLLVIWGSLLIAAVLLV